MIPGSMKYSRLSVLVVVPAVFLAFSCGGTDDAPGAGGKGGGAGAGHAGGAGKGGSSGSTVSAAGSEEAAGTTGETGGTGGIVGSAGEASGGDASGGDASGGEGGADSLSCVTVGSCLATNGVCYEVAVEAKQPCEANAGSIWVAKGCIERAADVGGGCKNPDCSILWQPTSVAKNYPAKKLQCEGAGGIWVVAPTK